MTDATAPDTSTAAGAAAQGTSDEATALDAAVTGSDTDPAATTADAVAGSDAGSAADVDDIGYTAALAELADILHELDGDEVDVDVLGGRVRRAAELLRICRGRIASARFEVEQVVAELDPAALPADAAPSDDDG